MSPILVYNAEPLGFSHRARADWECVGTYVEGGVDDPELITARLNAKVLIVRLGRRIDSSFLNLFPKLRWLISATTGLDHLDLTELKSRKIDILSLRGETEFLSTIPSTAEHTFALLLAMLRNLPAAVASVQNGNWMRDTYRGRQLKGRKLGLVGLGRTGRMVAEYATAFGVRIAYFDPGVDDPSWKKKETLDDLLIDSEIVSLHVHLDESTVRMIGRRELGLLQDGAMLVNTSRGALIDEDALVESLRTGRMAGVAVDVLANELVDICNSPLWCAMKSGLPVIITPHVGGATLDAMQQCEEFIAQKFLTNMNKTLAP